MKTALFAGLVAAVLSGIGGIACAQEQKSKLSPGGTYGVVTLPTTPLDEILDAVGRKSGIRFVTEARVSPNIVTGQLRAKDLNYATLLTVLANNGLAAVTIGDVVSIVPLNTIRQYPLPVLTEADASIADQEWVTMVYQLERVPAKELVPIVRPILPQAGHLAANPSSNSILLVDRYANVKRVIDIIGHLEEHAKDAPQ